jgi:ribosomal protein S17
VKVIECKPISKNISTVVVDVARPQIPEVV